MGTNGKKLKRGATVVLESMFYQGVGAHAQDVGWGMGREIDGKLCY